MRTRASALGLLLLLGIAPNQRIPRTGSFRLLIPGGSYVSQSRIPVEAAGLNGPFRLSLLGPGKFEGTTFVAPSVVKPLWTTLVASSQGAVAYAPVRIVPPPPANANLIAVATYRSGIVLHDPRTFATLGNVMIGGPPSDVAFLGDGSLAAADTDGDSLTRITRSPWALRQTGGVPEGNEILADRATGDLYVTNRDFKGRGALTRIDRNGVATTIATGLTAEGLALDPQRSLAYIGNVNDNTIAVVDTRSMRIVQKLQTVRRPFGVALDSRRRRLFVVSNESPSMVRGGGYVAAINLANLRAPTVRSPKMEFPLGAAFDAATGRLFVTDEGANVIYILNAATMHAIHAPIATCSTPWHPRIAGGRLYVPCAREDRVDVIDARTLRRIHNAPFPTGGYPLSVAVWK